MQGLLAFQRAGLIRINFLLACFSLGLLAGYTLTVYSDDGADRSIVVLLALLFCMAVGGLALTLARRTRSWTVLSRKYCTLGAINRHVDPPSLCKCPEVHAGLAEGAGTRVTCARKFMKKKRMCENPR